MDHGLGQVELRLGQAHVLDGVAGGDGHDEAPRVGHADVLAGQDDEAPGDEAGVLARLEHAGQPVEAGVGVAAPDALDERADHVVVLVAAVAQGLGAERGLGVGSARWPRCPAWPAAVAGVEARLGRAGPGRWPRRPRGW